MMVFRLAISASNVAELSGTFPQTAADFAGAPAPEFSTVSCKGNRGFFSSCANRRANSRQAATRSLCTSRFRCSISSQVMRLKASARLPKLVGGVTGT